MSCAAQKHVILQGNSHVFINKMSSRATKINILASTRNGPDNPLCNLAVSAQSVDRAAELKQYYGNINNFIISLRLTKSLGVRFYHII